MRSQKSKLRSYALYLKHICPQLSSIETLIQHLRHPATGFGDHSITFPVTCTRGRNSGSQQLCQIFEELPLWNELLWFIRVELKEMVPGLLHVARLPHAIVPPERRQEAERAAVFLHWLLTQHWCIHSVEIDSCLLQTHHQLFCDAVLQNASLRQLRLSRHELDVRRTANLVSAICGIRQLEELECDQLNLSGVEESLLSCFSDFIRNSALLKVLKVTRVQKMQHVEVFMQALQGNSSITRLIIEAPLTAGSIADFCKFLAGSTVLAELCLDCYTEDLLDYIEPLCKVLAVNKKLQKLTVRNHRFDLVDATLFSDMVAVNTTLKELAFCHCEWDFLTPWLEPSDSRPEKVRSAKARWGEFWRVEPFVHAVRNNTSLKEMVLDTNNFLDNELERLLVAVKESDSLKKLWFHHFSVRSTLGTRELLQKTDTLGKVCSMYYCCNSLSFGAAPFDYRGLLTVTEYTFYDLTPEHLGAVCTALESSDFVVRLDLHIKQYEMVVGEDGAAPLAGYLASACSLRQLRLRFRATDEAARIITAGLCKNTSVERLHVYGWSFADEDVRSLCEWIEQSRSVYYFAWLCTGYGRAADALVSELSGRLEENRTLALFRVSECRQDEEEWQAVQHVARRNAALVERAARFVLGSTLKRCASAFEAVSWHPHVKVRVREMADLSAAEAVRRIEESARRLQNDFWQLSEIVREQICCHERVDGVVQLDQLGFDGLLAVRQFLKVGDIADSRPPHCRKGRKRKASEESV